MSSSDAGIGTNDRRIDPSVLWTAAGYVGLILVLATIEPLLRYAHVVPLPAALSHWELTPSITLGVLLAAALYIAGHRQPAAAREDRYRVWRHVSFFGGLTVLYLMLQSPLETLSDHLFFVHQIEHMTLRTTGPFLLVLAAPQAALLRGMPRWLRRRVIAPVFGSRIWRAVGILAHPAVATALFVGTTYFWMIPRFHDIALLDEPVHVYLWHTSLFLTGLIFFWRILDARPYPLGASLGTRLLMFWLSSIGNILLGSYLSFKHVAIYPAYAEMGRFFGIGALTDETWGGLTMWIPGSMMFAITVMLMIFRWGQQEEHSFARAQAEAGPNGMTIVSAASLADRRRQANRRTAIGLVGFVATVLVITFISIGVYHYSDVYENFAFSNPVVTR